MKKRTEKNLSFLLKFIFTLCITREKRIQKKLSWQDFFMDMVFNDPRCLAPQTVLVFELFHQERFAKVKWRFYFPTTPSLPVPVIPKAGPHGARISALWWNENKSTIKCGFLFIQNRFNFCWKVGEFEICLRWKGDEGGEGEDLKGQL